MLIICSLGDNDKVNHFLKQLEAGFSSSKPSFYASNLDHEYLPACLSLPASLSESVLEIVIRFKLKQTQFLYGTPFSGKTSPRLLCEKVRKQQTIPAFVVTTNGNASSFSKIGTKWSAIYSYFGYYL